MSTTPYPVRPPAPGPALVLDLAALWNAVELTMRHNDMVNAAGDPKLTDLCKATGLDRNSVGRFRQRARRGDRPQGHRGGIGLNAYLTLTAFVAGGPLPGTDRIITLPPQEMPDTGTVPGVLFAVPADHTQE